MKSARTKIVARICGGLGNQLFIYASSLALTLRMGIQLELDTTSGFTNDHVFRRKYLLDQFRITASAASVWDSFPGRLGRWRESLAIRLARTRLATRRWQFIDESTVYFNHNVFKYYLRGYWQSETYFREIAERVRREFLLIATLPVEKQAELARIRGEVEPVALGVRRFEEVPAKERPPAVDIEFYRRAIIRVAESSPRAHIYIFTEDVQKTKAELRCHLPHTYVTHSPENRCAYENLTLMRACKQFIIGGSSYHWWGAWLADAPDKAVIVPREFAEAKPKYYPPEWERL